MFTDLKSSIIKWNPVFVVANIRHDINSCIRETVADRKRSNLPPCSVMLCVYQKRLINEGIHGFGKVGLGPYAFLPLVQRRPEQYEIVCFRF